MHYFHTINIQVDSLTKISNDIIGFVFQSFLSIYLKLNSKNFYQTHSRLYNYWLLYILKKLIRTLLKSNSLV
jgi:hypothetical protein